MRYAALLGLALLLGGCGSKETTDDPDSGLVDDVEDCTDGIDNDSDGLSDCDDSDCESTCDVDGDGAISMAFGGDDCDDNNGAVYPTAVEICDGIDNNCDGLADDDDPNVDASDSAWYADSDQDGYGDPDQAIYRCDPPAAPSSQDPTDCNDNNGNINPGATEVCDNVDNNCDGLIDDDDPALDLATRRTWWADFDGDGFGDPAITLDACMAPSGHVNNELDCDDANDAVNPDAIEICDGVDNECDGNIDNLIDADSDGYIACGLLPDCDDLDPYTYPTANEICDGIDNDCDTYVPADEDDIDGDGLRICDGDCDDLDPAIGVPAEWFLDNDGDGHGAGAPEPLSCNSPGPNYVPYLGDDCDDTDPLVYPGAYEFCGDYFDADCDGGDCSCTAFNDPSYFEDMSYQDALPGTTMTMTWDGVEYWSTSGGGPGGDRLAQYDGYGALLQLHQPNVDWRAVFTKEDGIGPVFGRGFGASQILVMSGPGQFQNDVVLGGGLIDSQSAVAFDTNRREFVALNPGGEVYRWDEAGVYIGAVTLQGWGTQANEANYPQDRGVAWACDYYLTYSEGQLSAWDTTTGDRLASTILSGAGMGFDSHFSLSFTNGRVFIIDGAGGAWRGFDVF